MKSVTFQQANCQLAKDQEEYETLHVYTEMKEIEVPLMVPLVGPGGAAYMAPSATEKEKKEVPWTMTACFELSAEEIEEIVRTGKIWHTQIVFGNQFHPIIMTTKNPFN